MAAINHIQPLSASQLLQLQDYFGLNLKVLQAICESVSQRVSCDISIMAEAGVIVASSIPGRLGLQHQGAQRILLGELDYLDVSAEMERQSDVMLEGCNQPIELDGARIASVGITAPLAKARDYAAIVQTCIELMLQSHLVNWRSNQSLSEQFQQTSYALKQESAEKRLVEASLLASEQRLQEISDYMFDSIWETGPDHRYTYVSEEMRLGLGLARENIIGKTRWQYSEPFLLNKDQLAWQRHQQDMEAHRDFRDFPYSLQLPSGEDRHLLVSGKAVFDPSGGFLGYRGAVRDVTQQYDAKEALRESEIRFKNIAESSSDWIWVMDERLRFSYVSDRFYEITGLQSEDIIGKTRNEFVGAEVIAADSQKWQEHFDDLRCRRRIKEFDYTGTRFGGESYCIKINGSPYFRSDGSFAGYHGTGTDFTELNNAREQLLRSEKLAALGGMVAGVAHEINTPVGNALTAASFISAETVTISDAFNSNQLGRRELARFLTESQETSDILLENLGRAITLIENFKQVAVDQSSDQVRSFKLAEYIDSVAMSLQPVLKQGGHQLRIECPAELEMHSEPGALYQVLTNLIMNSHVHGFSDGRKGEIALVVSAQQQQILIDYSDDGQGMDREEHRRIFEPFYTTKRGSGSSGLGMYLVYNLVTENLRGRLQSDSLPGKGVRFRLTLPTNIRSI
ncbi:MAG: PAS domain S-box protein [Motiliproteus sp.]